MSASTVREAVASEVVRDAQSFARTYPEFAVLLFVGLLALLVGGVALYRYLTRPEGARLARALERPDRITVLMHPNPDPDAMACALGVAAIARERGTETTLTYPGQIRHQENRAFRTVLDLDMKNVADAAELRGEVVLVDHNEPRGFRGAERIRPYAVVDHHSGEGFGEEFTDVRTDYGACASIIAEYLRDLGARPVPPEEADDVGEGEFVVSPEVATGLLYGIQSDTTQLTKGCSRADFEACAYLYPGIDSDALDRIANPQVSEEVLAVKARAIEDRDVDGSYAVCNVGELSNVDAIPQAADELLRLEGVTAVVVYGVRDDTIHLSGRSRDDRVHMGQTLAAVVDDIPMGSAGGHARMGGGQLSMEHMEGLGPATGITTEELHQRLFDAMAGDI